MTRFSARTRAEAVVAAPRADLWAALTDPSLVAELTPFLRRITEDGAHWRWEMSGLTVLGVGVAPAFTERMTTTGRGASRSGTTRGPAGPNGRPSRGGTRLEEVAAGTRLTTALETSSTSRCRAPPAGQCGRR